MDFPAEQLNRIAHLEGTPTFVYSETVLKANMARILNSAKKHGLYDRINLYVAYFCNSNPHLFRAIANKGVGILLQTKEEYIQSKHIGLRAKIIVSPSVLSDQEIDFWVRKRIPVNLSSLEEVKYFIVNHRYSPLSFRIDLTKDGAQRTAIKVYQLQQLARLLNKEKISPYSFHVYVGTGSSCEKILKNSEKAFKIFKEFFPNAKHINLGGGFGFDYSAGSADRKHFPWDKYFKGLKSNLAKYHMPEDVDITLEPGRDIFADAGRFFISVKRIIKHKRNVKIATDGSYVYVPSSTIRKRQHRVHFFTKDFRERQVSHKRGFLSGCTTLSSDYVFPGSIAVPENISDGDFVVIEDMGAYAATQHMEFLNKKPCSEVLIQSNGGVVRLTRRGDDNDKLRYLVKKPIKI